MIRKTQAPPCGSGTRLLNLHYGCLHALGSVLEWALKNYRNAVGKRGVLTIEQEVGFAKAFATKIENMPTTTRIGGFNDAVRRGGIKAVYEFMKTLRAIEEKIRVRRGSVALPQFTNSRSSPPLMSRDWANATRRNGAAGTGALVGVATGFIDVYTMGTDLNDDGVSSAAKASATLTNPWYYVVTARQGGTSIAVMNISNAAVEYRSRLNDEHIDVVQRFKQDNDLEYNDFDIDKDAKSLLRYQRNAMQAEIALFAMRGFPGATREQKMAYTAAIGGVYGPIDTEALYWRIRGVNSPSRPEKEPEVIQWLKEYIRD